VNAKRKLWAISDFFKREMKRFLANLAIFQQARAQHNAAQFRPALHYEQQQENGLAQILRYSNDL